MVLLFLFLLLHLVHSVTAGTVRSGPPTIKILSFSTSSSLYHTWNFQADPVMGGKSSGSFLLQSTIGILSGTVRDVPSLQPLDLSKSKLPRPTRFQMCPLVHILHSKLNQLILLTKVGVLVLVIPDLRKVVDMHPGTKQILEHRPQQTPTKT